MRNDTKDRISTSRPEEYASEHFTFDRRGNKHNVTFGPGKYEVPRHRNAGRGSVVGLESSYRVSKETGRVELFEPDPASRVHTPSGLGLPTSAVDEVIEEVRGDQTLLSHDTVHRQRNFIALSRRKRRRLGTEDNQYLSTSESDGSQPEDELSPNPTTKHPQDEYEAFRSNPRRQRIVEFERRVRKDPDDIDAWRGLIEDQYDSTLRSSNISQSRLEIYERALKQGQSNKIQQELTMDYLREGEQRWDSHGLLQKWKTALKEVSSTKLWIEYLNIRQTGVQSFNLDEWLKVAITSLRKVHEYREDATSIYAAHILLRILTVLRQSGFAEKAIALLQALFEWYYPQPDSETPRDLETFKARWSSEDKHFGEAAVQTNPSHFESSDIASNNQSNGVAHNGSSLSDWGTAEQQRMLQARMPANLLDENISDDPFRVVVIEDFEDLFVVLTETNDVAKDLISVFLLFCQLPPLAKGSSVMRALYDEYSVRQFTISMPKPAVPYRCGVDNGTLFSDHSSLIDIWPAADQLPWLDMSWVRRCLREFNDRSAPNDDLLEYMIAFELRYFPDLAKKTTRSLLKKHPESLRLYNAFALVQCRLDCLTEAIKVWSTALFMKQSLKKSEQIYTGLLWRSWIWATLEAESASIEETLKVFAKMLEIELGLSRVDIDTLFASRRSEIGLLLDNLVHQRTTEILDTSVMEQVVHWYNLQALFHYLISPTPSLTEASKCYDDACERMESTSPSTLSQLQELLHQARGRLVHLHTRLYPTTYKPKQVIEIIHQSLTKFPANTILLHLSRTHALPLDRLRGILPALTSPASLHLTADGAKSVPKPHTLYPPSYPSATPSQNATLALNAIVTELTRSESHGSNVHSIRSAFRRALDLDQPSPAPSPNSTTTTLTHSPSLWSNHLNWEASILPLPTCPPALSTTPAPAPPDLTQAETKALLALRQLYLRSLSACPWSKDLHLLAFTHPVITLALKTCVKSVGRGQTGGSKIQRIKNGGGYVETGYGGKAERENEEGDGEGDGVLREIYQMMLQRGMRICRDWDGK